MKEYELTILIHPSLENSLEKPLTKIRKLIESSDGKIVKEDRWGKKRLAYKINKQDFAMYVYFELELPASAPLKISNNLNISEDVLRYLLVTVDKKSKQVVKESSQEESKELKTEE